MLRICTFHTGKNKKISVKKLEIQNWRARAILSTFSNFLDASVGSRYRSIYLSPSLSYQRRSIQYTLRENYYIHDYFAHQCVSTLHGGFTLLQFLSKKVLVYFYMWSSTIVKRKH